MKEREKKERTQAWECLGKWSPLVESGGTMLSKNAWKSEEPNKINHPFKLDTCIHLYILAHKRLTQAFVLPTMET